MSSSSSSMSVGNSSGAPAEPFSKRDTPSPSPSARSLLRADSTEIFDSPSFLLTWLRNMAYYTKSNSAEDEQAYKALLQTCPKTELSQCSVDSAKALYVIIEAPLVNGTDTKVAALALDILEHLGYSRASPISVAFAPSPICFNKRSGSANS